MKFFIIYIETTMKSIYGVKSSNAMYVLYKVLVKFMWNNWNVTMEISSVDKIDDVQIEVIRAN